MAPLFRAVQTRPLPVRRFIFFNDTSISHDDSVNPVQLLQKN